MKEESIKYSRLEIERRWLVDESLLPDLSNLPTATILDKYLDGGRLRLRRFERSGEPVAYKLGKKYGRFGDFSELITNLYLTESEYLALGGLSGIQVCKKRISLVGGSLDIYEFSRKRILIFESEFAELEDALNFKPPKFIGEELKTSSKFSGYRIARAYGTRD